MGKIYGTCVVCGKLYHGQGKKCCSIECKNVYLTGKKLNITDEHRKMLSEKATNQFKNKHLSQEQKDKISAAGILTWSNEEYYNTMCDQRKGHEVTQETRDKISKSQSGRSNPWTIIYNQNRIPPYGWHHTEKSKQKIREKVSGNKNGQFGKSPAPVKYVNFIDINGRTFKFRSSWEAIFAKYLDSHNIHWNYEVKAFVLSDGGTYTPDFFTDDCIYEVKGHFYKRSKEKFECFKKDYNLKIVLVDRNYFLENLKIKL